MEFKYIIQSLRKEKKYNQEELAAALGVSKSTVAMWESGQRTPARAKLEEIADMFDVDIDYLYGKTEIRKRTILDSKGNLEYGLSETEYLKIRCEMLCEMSEQILAQVVALESGENNSERRFIEAYRNADDKIKDAIKTLLALQ